MKKHFILLVSCLTLFIVSVSSQSDSTRDEKIYKVGIKITPPFIIKNDDPVKKARLGEYTGVCIDLWKLIADSLNIKYEYKLYNLIDLLEAVKKGDVDVSINPLTVTSDRLQNFNFTQPFFISNLAIAVNEYNEDKGLLVYVSNIFTTNFFEAVSLLIVVIFSFGLLIWISERKQNPNFNKGVKGLGDGMWWSSVTMATVGYGDKVPITPIGRAIATVWMFTSVIIISSLTASIAASLTANKINSNISNIYDLQKRKVGTIKESSSHQFLKKYDIKFKEEYLYNDIPKALLALANKEINAFVYDEPIIRYLIGENKLEEKVFILPMRFNSDYYSFAFPKNSVLLDKINPILIKQLESVIWLGILNEYNLKK